MEKLEAYIEAINTSKTPVEAFNRYCEIMKRFGYDRVVYSLMTDHPSLNLPRQHGLVSSYPQHWIDYYNDMGYMDYDPVAQELVKTLKPFFWDDLLQEKKISDLSVQVMNEAGESGLHDGLAFSMPGKYGEVTAFGLARTDREAAKARDYSLLASLHLLSVYFHETFRQMHKSEKQIDLTDREKEILQWASEGKSDDVIADILAISQNTVRFHWKNIFEKLDACGRVFAVTKALRLEIISPVLIRSCYQKR